MLIQQIIMSKQCWERYHCSGNNERESNGGALRVVETNIFVAYEQGI